MAKTDNLKDFLTDVAGAIREKKGTTALINPQDFSTEILSIETGGGGATRPSADYNDVVFIDYDGHILYSYSKSEFLALSEMPPLPTMEGLICQEWNWPFDGAQDYVRDYGVLVVGATYITDDGKTRVYITITSRLVSTFNLYLQGSGTITVDWGDGTVEEFASVQTVSHQYSRLGDFIVTILGTNYNFTANINAGAATIKSIVRRVEFGTGVTSVGWGGLNSYYGLETVTLPKQITTFPQNAMYSAFSLKAIVLPRNIEAIGINGAPQSYAAKFISLGYQLSTLNNFALSQAYSVKTMCIPEGVSVLPQSLFGQNYTMITCVVPSSVSTINASAFYNCYSLLSVLCVKHTSVPTLSNTNAFTGVHADCKIVIPDALYEEWIAATNWSAIASKIIKKSDWDSLQ